MIKFSKLTAWRASSVIALGITGLVFGLAGSRSHAQQDSSRQLVQANEQRPVVNRRIALVIGNGAYTNAPPLKNPPNDARDMAATLKQLGFTVASAIDADQRTMKRLIRDFGQQLKGGSQGLFYYAGHGVQMRGRNYLIPANAEIASETDVEDQGVDLNLVLGLMDEAQNGLNIVILDACRNNPFSRSFRSAGSGLAQVDAPTGTLIAYATAPGRVASDGNDRNGLYTSALLKNMRVPGLNLSEMFMRVRAEVMMQTGKRQVPWEMSSLVGTFYFTQPENVAGGNDSASTGFTTISQAAKEQALWEAVKDSNEPGDIRDYMKKYPNGAYVDSAIVKLRRLGATKNSEVNGNSATSQSANVGGSRMGAPLSSLFDERNRDVQAFATIYATRIGQRSYLNDAENRSYFSWTLTEGLEGAAANDYGEITLRKLAKYVEETVPKRIVADPGRSTKEQGPFAIIEGYHADLLIIALTNQGSLSAEDTSLPPLGSTFPSKAKRWALIVGVEKYAHKNIGNKKYASNDAQALAKALIDNAGFPNEQVILLTTNQPPDLQPTRTKIITQLHNLSTMVPKDGLLLVSFTGLGIEAGTQSYLLPSDALVNGQVSTLEESTISLSRVKERIKSIGASQIIILLDASLAQESVR
ncbi:MAG: hypothetical protein QOF62_3012 [Pyrinomonadaceae bacterium]|jgi:uncharacterized caspase-like protein|nr:hypothetical protein [Pyrinomonadaceae bacterium]